jgi:hypothetical protein
VSSPSPLRFQMIADQLLGSNGANLSFPQTFGIVDSGPGCKTSAEAAATCDKNSWIVGLINSLPYITIAFACVQGYV